MSFCILNSTKSSPGYLLANSVKQNSYVNAQTDWQKDENIDTITRVFCIALVKISHDGANVDNYFNEAQY